MLELETSLWESVARGTLVYLAIALLIRIIPKRQAGSLSPNDLIALVLMGNLAATAIVGASRSVPDILLLLVVVMIWDYLFNLVEYYVPRVRRIAQDSPTLLIYNGVVLKKNLSKEKLTEEELAAALREHGVADVRRVKQAVLEVNGQISVIEKE